MKSTGQEIIIESPCAVSWEKMEAAGADRKYCGVCCKQVIDANNMNNDELVEIISSNGNACIRIREDRLRKGNKFFAFLTGRKIQAFIALLFLFASCKTKSVAHRQGNARVLGKMGSVVKLRHPGR
jgi:hypothetical protein